MKKLYGVFYAVILAVLLFFFFTNDFGLVDIRKSAIVVALGIDGGENGLNVTAQVAVPQPSESGNATQCAQISGEGKTVGEALNQINVKAGFYPKLTFCQLILLGESALSQPVFQTLDYFYRGDYIARTALIAVCKGDASEVLAKQTASGEIPAEAIGRTLSQEVKLTANVASVSLKDIAVDNLSASAGCYMPYVDYSAAEGGAAIGSEGTQTEGEKFEFFCNRTAIFSGGEYAGLLNEEQTFALNLLKNPVRLAILPVEYDGQSYVLGLKNVKGGVAVKGKDEDGEVVASFKCVAEIRGADGGSEQDYSPVPDGALRAASQKLDGMFADLFEFCAQANCDALQLKTIARAKNYKLYKARGDSLYDLPFKSDISVKGKN